MYYQCEYYCFHTPFSAVATQTAIAPNHSVAWNDGRVGVLAASIGYRTSRILVPDLNRNFSIGSDLPSRYFFHSIPNLDLERGPLKRRVLNHDTGRDNSLITLLEWIQWDLECII